MKTLLVASIQTLTFLTAGVWHVYHSSDLGAVHQAGAPVPSAARSPATALKPLKMWANDTSLHQSDTFELHFTIPNAPFLGVVDPKGHFFYLVFPAENTVGALKPLVESKNFIALQTLKINTKTLVADPYIYGLYTNQPVFTTSGNYTFILGENLHVDDPGLLDKVVVHYTNARRLIDIAVK